MNPLFSRIISILSVSRFSVRSNVQYRYEIILAHWLTRYRIRESLVAEEKEKKKGNLIGSKNNIATFVDKSYYMTFTLWYHNSDDNNAEIVK
ncbi:hypothetical protein PUN28_018897 [Cardiocondyla obscurior]|uniref:Uncharacterized protein n=1 Tax=Cardiocondyla obscurior TaxID=286306 RepID=A0AAW2EGB6_9HYME